MNESPLIVQEFQVTLHGRERDKSIAFLDGLSGRILDLIGGEPWVMIDDDWQRVQPPQRLTIVDDQGFMYMGRRRYSFSGPFVGSTDLPQRDGYRLQKGDAE